MNFTKMTAFFSLTVWMSVVSLAKRYNLSGKLELTELALTLIRTNKTK